MKHEDIDSMTAERYLLDEMTEEESRAFEEHYFDCTACADAVRNGATFIDSGKKLVRVDEPVGQYWPAADHRNRRVWTTWLPTAAAASFAAMLSYQTFVTIPRIHEQVDRPTTVTFHDLSETRAGAGDKEFVLGRDKVTEITFAIDSDQPVSHYRWRIVDGSGAVKGVDNVSVEQAQEPISVFLPSSLPAGSYSLVVEGVREDGNRFPISRTQFVVRKRSNR